MATNPIFSNSQDNWDDEDEDEEKKAEITKTGMLEWNSKYVNPLYSVLIT